MKKLNHIKKYDCWKKNRKIRREMPELWHLKSTKFGYIQIPKVASRSIRLCLSKFYVESKKLKHPEIWDKKSIKDIETQIAFHTSHKEIVEIAKEHFIFSFVRNPYSRIYSAYKNKVILPLERGGENIFYNHGITLGMDFESFVDKICTIPDQNIDRHLRSQSWFLTFEDKLIPDYIGHLETFATDWEKLSNKFGLPEAEQKNRTENIDNKNISEHFTLETKEKIRARYHKDFILFNYNDNL